MANYECTIRTNYFRVTDEEAYKKLINWISAEDFYELKSVDGERQLHGFGIYGSASYYVPASENAVVKKYVEDNEDLYDENSNVVPVDEYDNTDALYNKEGIMVYDNHEDDNFDYFLTKLQEILPDDEVFVYMEAGHEKLRYVTGFALVATNKEIRTVNLESFVDDTTNELIGRTTSYVY